MPSNTGIVTENLNRLALGLLIACAPLISSAKDAIPVLMYHQITDEKAPSETVISPRRFAEQMSYLAEHKYTTVSMDELVAIMQGKMAMPAKPVHLSFDDGWKNVVAAIPILDKHGFKASFWIITEAGADSPHLSWTQIIDLAKNPRFEVQSHTATHPWQYPHNTLQAWMQGKTPGKGPDDVRSELERSKKMLEQKVGRPVDYLSWPLGLYNEEMIALAKDVGYKALLTTDNLPGNMVGGDIYRIHRLTIHGGCDLITFVQQLADHVNRKCEEEARTLDIGTNLMR